MWKPALTTALITLMALLVGCKSPSPVATDYDTDADFGSYRRYDWMEERSGTDKAFNPLLAERIRNAISGRLASRQFDAAGNVQPDFLVRYYLKTDDKVEESRARGGVSMGSFGGNVGMGVSMSFPLGGTVVEQRALLLIDFIDGRTQKMTWRGSRSFVIRGEDPVEVDKQIRAVVDEILAVFPPQH
jgi:hypothetical protein